MKTNEWTDRNPGDSAWGHFFTESHEPGKRLHYIRKGDSSTHVLLVHAYPGFWYDWRRIIPELS